VARGFENDEPIDDAIVVLDLVVPRWDERMTTREIDRRFKKEGPYVEVGHHRDFSDSSIYRFRITDRVADALVADHSVAGKREWGYTDDKRLRATELGAARLWAVRSQLGLDHEHERFQAFWWMLATRRERG